MGRYIETWTVLASSTCTHLTRIASAIKQCLNLHIMGIMNRHNDIRNNWYSPIPSYYSHSHTTKERSVHIRGVGRNFSMGGRFKCYFLKGSFCTDLDPNTLYKKCIKFSPKKGGLSDPPPPLSYAPAYSRGLYTLIFYKAQRYVRAGRD